MTSSAATSPTPYTLKTILKYKPFRTLWLAQFVSIFGDFLALFGVISLITFRWHGTPVQVTTVTIAFVFPMAIISPIAGVFVDHWNVKRLMIASDLIRAGLILMLVFAHSVTQISAIFIVLSSVSSFFAPAQSVTIRTIVPPEGLLAANALMMQAFYIVRLLSPAVAGALVAWLTEKSCFYLDVASFIFSATMIAGLSVIRPARAQGEKSVKSLAQDFVAGNKFIFTHAGLAFVFIAMAVAMFVLSSFSPLISIYIRDSLHAGSFVFGAISAMVGVGMIVGTQLVTRLARSGSKSYVVLGGLFLLGAGAGLLGAFRNTPMAALSTFTMGFGIAFVWIPAQTMSQQETPPPMVGRVSSTFMSLISFSQVFGLLLSGYLAQRLGIRAVFVTCAGVLAVISAAGYFLTRGRTPQASTAGGLANGARQSGATNSQH
ncbi:MAG TPA: MFS transporter [Candidatus Polarisedimenticolia bacterium]|jgi:DHA3 family macrolide efflux protein-like MFS transporter|nr:MFS transporter [Candidatus Polarisedimenticolia bacterium]